MARRSAAERELAVHRRLMQFGAAESLATPMWEQRGTSVAAIEAQLAHLWAATAGGASGVDALVTEKGVAHARASVLNLIVTVPEAEAADRVVHTLMGLGIRHPSRAIVLVADPHARGRSLDARISTHCNDNMIGEQVCYEEVVLTVRGEAAEHLSGVVAPLLIHDLPTYTWWPGDPPFRDAVFDQLIELSDRIIVDSADFADLLGGVRRLANVRHRTGVGDLSWERLAFWQERIAQFFDGPRFRRYLPNLDRLSVRYAVRPPHSRRRRQLDATRVSLVRRPSPIAQALLLSGWLAARLDWRRYRTDAPLENGRMRLTLEGNYEMVDVRLEPEETDAVAAGEITSVHLRAFGEAGAAEFILDRHGDEATVATNADGMTALLRRITVRTPRESELLSQQLAGDVTTPVYEAALRASAAMLLAAREEGAPGPSPSGLTEAPGVAK
jgi:glucose-6-phosphate dehydrogenase assembly protein OpcA